jgi:ribonuclease Z
MTQLSIIFLGTGGSWPTVKRNVTSIAVKRNSEVLLFDCGEGTQRQFQKSPLSYMQITNIFVTHFHGDHFLGIPGLLQTMQLNDRHDPIHLYGPKGMNALSSQLLHLGYFKPNYQVISHEVTDGDVINCQDYSIKVVHANHNVPAVAYSLEENMRPGKFNKLKALEMGVPEGPLFSRLQKGQNIILEDGREILPNMVLGLPRKGRKIVISGDTAPSEKIIKLAKRADILIHEGTFASDFENNAHEYGHSTAKQAAQVAKDACVDRLFLTHISPRYMDKRVIENDAREIFLESYVPRDFQNIIVSLKN